MSKALSLDLRVRVLAAVAGGMTHRSAGERFGVSAASVSRWRTREREQGNARPKALGGDRKSRRIKAHGESVLAALGPDATGRSRRCAMRSPSLAWGSARFCASSDATSPADIVDRSAAEPRTGRSRLAVTAILSAI